MALSAEPLAIVFDVGGVLLEVDLDLAPQRWSAAAGMDLDKMREVFWADRDYQPLERGEISLEDYRRSMNRRLGAEIPAAAFHEGWTGVFRGEIAGMAELAVSLAKKLRLCCLSNTNAAHAETFIARFGRLFEPFERLFYSHELHLRKPDPHIYTQVLEYLDSPAGSVIFVDDKLANVTAAAELGMRGVCFENAAQLRAVLKEMGLLLY